MAPMHRCSTLMLVVATALTALDQPSSAVQAFSIFGGPKIDGEALSWDGDGDKFTPKKAFKDGDKFIKVTLTNWKMDASANLSIPTTVKMLSLINCRLEFIPDEVRALEQLEKLNLANNLITSADGALASAGVLQSLNLSNNAIANYSLQLPAANLLDLSQNKLTTFPTTIFASPLVTFGIDHNGFQLASVSQLQFDFFAGLNEFDADFAAITSCKNHTTLVTLKGNKICRIDDDVLLPPTGSIKPTLVPSTSTTKTNAPIDGSKAAGAAGATIGTTPAATVGVVTNPQQAAAGIRHLHSDSTYILGGLIALLLATVFGAGAYALVTRRQTLRYRGKLHEATPLFFDSDKRTEYQRELDAGDKLFPSHDQVLVTWRVDYDSVKLVKKIAKGAFGEVWIGRYRGTKVAVKKLLSDSASSTSAASALDASEDFVREIKLMAWLQHPKVVEFVGVAWTKLVDMLAVLEFMDSGDLRSLLDADRSLTWRDRKLAYALDTVDALVYLHSLSPVIIHRDLKSRNILVDARKGAKLGDFGISAAKREAQDMTTGVGTTRWLAPELARGEVVYTEAVDMYSFGVILSELDTHELPFSDARAAATGEKLSDFAVLQGVASGTLRVSFSPTCPPKILEIAVRCVSLDPKARPTASEVAYLLRQRDLLLS